MRVKGKPVENAARLYLSLFPDPWNAVNLAFSSFFSSFFSGALAFSAARLSRPTPPAPPNTT